MQAELIAGSAMPTHRGSHEALIGYEFRTGKRALAIGQRLAGCRLQSARLHCNFHQSPEISPESWKFGISSGALQRLFDAGGVLALAGPLLATNQMRGWSKFLDHFTVILIARVWT